MKWIRLNRKKKVNTSDEELLKEYLATHDQSCIEQLFDRYLHLVYGVCLKYLKDREKAQDATMYIFERLLIYLKLNQVHNFRSWLYSTTKNHCLMEIRKTASIEKNNQELFMENDSELHPIDETNEENIKMLEKCIEFLDERQKDCIELFYIQNNSYQQIADLTGYEIKRIKSYIQNGRRNLKICMEKNEEKARI